MVQKSSKFCYVTSIDDELTNIWTLVYFPRIITDKYVNNCKYFFVSLLIWKK